MKRKDFDYELIDCGRERRIERFGDITVNRPCPQALDFSLNDIVCDAYFERERANYGWKNTEKLPEHWNIQVGPITAQMRFSPNSQVGIFPEQFDNWQWIHEQVHKNPSIPRKILNTFSYTGMSTLFASTPHTEVCHVDGAKSAISWARTNAELSGLADNHIRWICDDVQQFMAREIRRGKKYDGIILDPPAFGRGAKKDWKIERDLQVLMDMVEELLTDDPLFVILTCHAPDHYSPEDFAEILESLPQFKGKKAEKLILEIPSEKGKSLPSSFGARISS